MVVNTGTEEHNGLCDHIGGSRIKTLKMLGAVGRLFYLYLGGKKVSLFSKQVKMLEV